jgi:GH15 family glucan-1,4-alpha-glucosidase
MSNTAIADHALLSDRHSSALVDRSGSVEWLSFPRFDSPSVFDRAIESRCGALEHHTGSAHCRNGPLPFVARVAANGAVRR